MIKNSADFKHKIHLIISVFIVVPVAFIYAINPAIFFNIHPNTIDEYNVLKAIMGLYLGFSLLWLMGVFNTNYLKLALLSNMIFMLGLGFGRIASILIDGIPSSAYVFGTLGELVLGFYSLWVLKKSSFSIQKQ